MMLIMFYHCVPYATQYKLVSCRNEEVAREYSELDALWKVDWEKEIDEPPSSSPSIEWEIDIDNKDYEG